MNNLTKQLRLVQPLVKAKGATFETYGLVKDGILYFNNNALLLKMDVEIPFDCFINLHQLYSIVSTLKTEYVVVKKDDCVIVKCDNVVYNVDIHPDYERFEKTYIVPNDYAFYPCNNPMVFRQMINIATYLIWVVKNPELIEPCIETIVVDNNIVTCSNKKVIVQGVLDFAMPRMAFDLAQACDFNKIIKTSDKIVGMTIHCGYLVVKLDNGLQIFLEDKINHSDEYLKYFAVILGKINKAMDENWVQPNIHLTPFVKERIGLLNRLNNSNVIHLASSFCQANEQTIHFPPFTDDDFHFKFLYSDFKNLHKHLNMVKVVDNRLSFINDNCTIRGLVSGVLPD